jgi:P27 family predicted phage terminase small subunit
VSGRAPAPPGYLAAQGRGRRFWQQVVGEWECSPAELELLAEACRTLDELQALRRAVAREGATVAGSQGQRRAHPALTEPRLGRGELRRLLDALGLEAAGVGAEGEDVVSLTSRRAQRAARARWAKRGSSGHA